MGGKEKDDLTEQEIDRRGGRFKGVLFTEGRDRNSQVYLRIQLCTSLIASYEH